MNLLQELLEFDSGWNFDELYESLGNLRAINKHLLKLLMLPDRQHVKGRLKGKYGQNSPIETHHAKTYSEVFGMIPELGVLIMQVGDKQVLGIQHQKDDKKKDEYLLLTDPKLFGYEEGSESYDAAGLIRHETYFNKFAEAEYKNEDKPTYNRKGRRSRYKTVSVPTGNKTLQRFDYSSITKSGVPSGASKTKELIKMVLDAAKEHKLEVKTLTLGNDEEKLKKQKERIASRDNAEPFSAGNEIKGHSGTQSIRSPSNNTYAATVWFKEEADRLRSSLKSRLDLYKDAKANDAGNTPEEMLHSIIDKGYLKRIKFAGFTYVYYTESSFYMKNFENESANVEYKIQETSEEFKKLEITVDHLKKEFDKVKTTYPDPISYNERDPERLKVKNERDALLEKERKEFFEKHNIKIPPTSLKIYMGFKGGTIVPVKVEPSKESPYRFYIGY
jgi:hypothetical protein